jgi:hypothetical protein
VRDARANHELIDRPSTEEEVQFACGLTPQATADISLEDHVAHSVWIPPETLAELSEEECLFLRDIVRPNERLLH